MLNDRVGKPLPLACNAKGRCCMAITGVTWAEVLTMISCSLMACILVLPSLWDYTIFNLRFKKSLTYKECPKFKFELPISHYMKLNIKAKWYRGCEDFEEILLHDIFYCTTVVRNEKCNVVDTAVFLDN